MEQDAPSPDELAEWLADDRDGGRDGIGIDDCFPLTPEEEAEEVLTDVASRMWPKVRHWRSSTVPIFTEEVLFGSFERVYVIGSLTR